MKKILIIISCLLVVGCTKNTSDLPDYSKEISSLLEKNYTYSLLAYGSLEFEDATATVEDVKYNLIKNIDITSLEDLNKIVEEIFVPERIEIFYETLYEKRNFLEIDERIYIKDYEEGVTILKPDFNNFEINEQTEEHLIIDIGENSYYIYIRDGSLYLGDDIHYYLTEIINEESENLDSPEPNEESGNLDNLVD